MISGDQLTAARVRAGTTLADAVAFTRPGAGTFDVDDGMTTGTATAVWSGDCSISPAGREDRSEVGGGPTSIEEWVIRVPVACVGVKAGDDAAVTSADPDVPTDLTVTRVGARSTQVLRRITCARAVDVRGVPQ